jgi:hypothetical protein
MNGNECIEEVPAPGWSGLTCGHSEEEHDPKTGKCSGVLEFGWGDYPCQCTGYRMDKYDAEEGYDRLGRAWEYILRTYKRKGELPKKYWEAEEIIKRLRWDLFGHSREIERSDGSTITLNECERRRRV